ncbi:MAG: hypothetical protein LBU48_00815 [Coriobacteriales bacterium]|jgi:hypothetical protein|nr:hypothetical protein [Coriobacteriales bacterium]
MDEKPHSQSFVEIPHKTTAGAFLHVLKACSVSAMILVAMVFVAYSVGDVSLALLGWFSLSVFFAPLPSVVYSLVRAHKSSSYFYLAKGLAALFAAFQGFLLLATGAFLSDLFWLQIMLPPLLLILPVTYALCFAKVKARISGGAFDPITVKAERCQKALLICLVAAAAFVAVLFLLDTPVEWIGYVFSVLGILLMMVFSQEAVSLVRYYFIASI